MGDKAVHTMESINKRFRILYIAVVGLVLVIIGLIVFSLFKPVESATTPGTCLPIDKGGTGCDGEGLVSEYNISTKFIYTTTKQDTGRTTDDGYIIWGQKFVGTVTAGAGTTVNTVLTTGLPPVARLISGNGSIAWSGTTLESAMQIGGSAGGTVYGSQLVRRPNGTIAIESTCNNARSNSPYEAFVDWIDGTRR